MTTAKEEQEPENETIEENPVVAKRKSSSTASSIKPNGSARAAKRQKSDEPEFIPPSLHSGDLDIHDSFTYLSSIPSSVAQDISAPCILGVDEAGRGPVLGPMVYAVCYCRADFKDDLDQTEFDDSKVLGHAARSRLLKFICEEQGSNIGWATTTMSARDITSGMLRPKEFGVHNLNEQAHDTTMDLIQRILDRGVNVKEVYVDTVGPPEKYEKKLSDRFPGIKVTVTKKADSLFKIVSAASICAKVTRDAALKVLDESPEDETWGSGYSGDPRTIAWLNSNIDPIFGWNESVRFSWKNAKDLLEAEKNVIVEW